MFCTKQEKPNCTEAERRGDCTQCHWVHQCSASQLRGVHSFSASQCSTVVRSAPRKCKLYRGWAERTALSALQCSTAERSALRKSSISVGHHSFSAVQYSHWYTIVCLFTTVGQCNESTMLCWWTTAISPYWGLKGNICFGQMRTELTVGLNQLGWVDLGSCWYLHWLQWSPR